MEASEHESGGAASPARADVRRGELAGAAQSFLVSRRLDELPDEVFQLGVVCGACERCVAAADPAGADQLYRLLASFAGGRLRRAGGSFWTTTMAHYLGALASLTARWDVAAEHFEDALRAGAAAGAVLEVRRTQLAYVRLLLVRGAPGDLDKAQYLLAELIASLYGPGFGEPAGAPRLRAVSDAAAPPLRQMPRYRFRREGDYWALASEGAVRRVRSLRGFAYIAELLRHPHQPIYVVDLAALGASAEQHLDAAAIAEHGLRVSAEANGTPVLDRRARDAYRTRWRELLAEEAAARHDNDPGRLGRVEREIEMLAAQLSAAAGGRGNGRDGPSFKERARVNVRNCITGALRAVRLHDDGLWRHLSNSIKTGSFCCYAPDRPVEWDL
jgi:hypothetical protein